MNEMVGELSDGHATRFGISGTLHRPEHNLILRLSLTLGANPTRTLTLIRILTLIGILAPSCQVLLFLVYLLSSLYITQHFFILDLFTQLFLTFYLVTPHVFALHPTIA